MTDERGGTSPASEPVTGSRDSHSSSSARETTEAASAESTGEVKPQQRHVEQKDFYWSPLDADDDFDGFIHVVSCRDGSSLKIEIAPLLARLGIDTIKAALQSVAAPGSSAVPTGPDTEKDSARVDNHSQLDRPSASTGSTASENEATPPQDAGPYDTNLNEDR